MPTQYRLLPDERGFYGSYGGAFVPEILYNNVHQLQLVYKDLIGQTSFKEEYHHLLNQYVGRPTPLYEAKRL